MGEASQMLADDWRIQVWDAETGSVRTLGTARDIDDQATFQAYGDVVPTMNAENAYFSTAMRDGDGWRAIVVSGGLSGLGFGIVAEGGYPAAVTKVSCLQRDRPLPAIPCVFPEFPFSPITGETALLSIAPGESMWSVSGIWAHGDRYAVAFSSTTAKPDRISAYGTTPLPRLLHGCTRTPPTVVASMNEDWFVWGSGSQAEHAEMYAFNMNDRPRCASGHCPGYSRPSIAQGSNAVMLPVYTGPSDPVGFEVGMLS